jgi:Fis family transcriptional regulator, factor for inversion stimulation protein
MSPVARHLDWDSITEPGILNEQTGAKIRSVAKKEDFVKRELDSLVSQMHAGGITYDEAIREFKKRFILEVLAAHRGNQCKAAKELGMHRNTLSRTIAELHMDPAQIRNGLKRPPRPVRPLLEQPKQVMRQQG